MTQGDPLSPTIFNVVVDAVVRSWVMMSLAEAEKRGEKGNEGRHQATQFYAENGMVASSDPRWIQWDFDTLVSLFEQVGLRKNVGKTVRMVCHPCQAAGTQSSAAYGRKMMGEVPTYPERQKERVQCGECGKEMAVGSLASHRGRQRSGGAGKPRTWEANRRRTGWPYQPREGRGAAQWRGVQAGQG